MKILKSAVLLSFLTVLTICFSNDLISQNYELKPPSDVTIEKLPNMGMLNAAKLTWTLERESQFPDYFNVYIAEGKTDDLDNFEKIDYVKPGSNTMKYSYTASNLQMERYSFYLTSVKINANGSENESKASKIVYVDFEDNNNTKPYVKITSSFPLYAKRGEHFKHQITAQSNIRCPIRFELMKGPEGMEIDEENGLVTWTPKEDGIYNGAIKAYLECDEDVYTIQQFQLKVGETNEKDYVTITSKPITHIPFGETYYYEISAESNVKCPILYKWQIFISNSNGTADNIEGTGNIVKWLPDRAGYYVIFITAYLECNEKIQAYQRYTLKVGEDKKCAFIKGQLLYEDGSLVMEGTAIAYMLDKSDMPSKQVFQGSIKQGNLYLEVPEGAFILRFEGKSFVSEWYENAEDMNNATPFKVACNSVFELKAIVERTPEPNYYTVSGKVFDAETGAPVMATVEFIPLKYEKERDPNNSGFRGFITKTDKDGYYEIKLPDIYYYNAYTIPLDKNYLPQYYDKADNLWEADIIVIEKDLEGIDFALKARLEYKNGFTGIVKNSDDIGLKSKVLAYLVKDRANSDSKSVYMQSIVSDENGQFMFSNMIPGDYVLLSVPVENKYVPGYYVQGDFVTQQWREASKISVGEVMITLVYELTHKVRSSTKGFTEINGVVTSTNDGIKAVKGDILLTSKAETGVFLYVVDENNNIAGYAFSKESGEFTIPDLEQGVYTLYADKVGFETFSQIVDTDYNEKSSINLNIGLQSESSTSVDDEIANSNYYFFPSPAENTTNFYFVGTSGKAFVSVFNNLGMNMMSLEFGANNGENVRQIDVRSLPSGAYLVRVQNNGLVQTLLLNVIR